MGEITKIEWADHTFNPWIGCQKVGPACDNCYAEMQNARYSGGANWGPGAPRKVTAASTWAQPAKWEARAVKDGTRPFVFCLSLGDIWDNAVAPDLRRKLFSEVIRPTKNLVWLLLSKRIGNAIDMVKDVGGLPPNCALGSTIVTAAEVDRDMPKLEAAAEALNPIFTFLSIEPLIDDLAGSLMPWMLAGDVGGIFAGGESGGRARAPRLSWVRGLRDAAAIAGVPFMWKQWGEFVPRGQHRDRAHEIQISDAAKGLRDVGGTPCIRVGKDIASNWLDGVQHLARPAVPPAPFQEALL